MRYFACGEYGGKSERPHYHIILFNSPLDYFEYDPIHKKSFNPVMEDIWKKGMVDIGQVEHGSVHYVTKYHLFPLTEWSDWDKREKPFALMSRKPGIGYNYIDDDIKDYYNSNKNSFVTLKNGIRQPLGRYYKEKIYDEETLRTVGDKSREYARKQDKAKRKIAADEKDFLRIKRNEHESARKKAKRSLRKNNKL